MAKKEVKPPDTVYILMWVDYDDWEFYGTDNDLITGFASETRARSKAKELGKGWAALGVNVLYGEE